MQPGTVEAGQDWPTSTGVTFADSSSPTLEEKAQTKSVGGDSFTYRASDGTANSDVATVSLNVATNDLAPVAVDGAAQASGRKAINIAVFANDRDPDGFLVPGSAEITVGPSHGTVTIDATIGALSYRSDGSYTGADVMRYRVRDNQRTLSNEATVGVQVDNTNRTRNRKWVDSRYHDLLGRRRVVAETDYWVNVLDTGVSMETIATAFLTSRERRSGFIDQYYHDYLGRGVDAVGLDFWLGVCEAHQGPEVVRAALIGSGEYATAHGGTSDGVIRGLYQDVLGRPASGADVSYWSGVIARTPLANVVYGFLTSDEDRLGTIRDWYFDYLHRGIDSSGATIWLNKLKSGTPQHVIEAALLGSLENQQNARAFLVDVWCDTDFNRPGAVKLGEPANCNRSSATPQTCPPGTAWTKLRGLTAPDKLVANRRTRHRSLGRRPAHSRERCGASVSQMCFQGQ